MWAIASHMLITRSCHCLSDALFAVINSSAIQELQAKQSGNLQSKGEREMKMSSSTQIRELITLNTLWT